MGDRGQRFMGQQQAKPGEYAWLVYVLLFLFGLLLAALYVITAHKATAVGIISSVALVYVGFMLVTEMSENLFDLRDLTLLLSRPISDLTFSLSRALYILTFATKFSLPFLLPSIVAVAIVTPLFLPLYLLIAVLTITLTVTLTLGLYLTLLRSVPAKKFRRILGYAQMVFTVFFFLAYQLPSILADSDIDFVNLRLVGTPWGFGWPGLWLGGLWAVITELGGNWMTWAQAGLGLLATIFGVRYYVTQSSGYGEQLMAIQLAGSQEEDREPETKNPKARSSIGNRLKSSGQYFARLLTQPGAEQASFNFSWAIMLRDLKFKQQVYPSLVFLPIIFLLLIFRDFFEPDEAGRYSESSALFVLYLTTWMLFIPLAAGRQSDQFKAAWIFRALPIERPGAVFYGQYMAVIVQFLLPTVVLTYSGALYYYGLTILQDIFLSLAVVLLSGALFQALYRSYPFSEDKTTGGYESFGPFFLVSISSIIAGLTHYGISFIPYGVVVAGLIAWAVLWFALRGLRRQTSVR